MLEQIGELARNLVVIVFVATLLDLLVPQGSYSRYLRLIIGLLVILLVVTFMGTIMDRIPLNLSLIPKQSSAATELYSGEKGRELWESNRQEALRVYRSEVTALIEEAILDDGKWIPVSVNLKIEEDKDSPLFGTIYEARIKIKSAAGPAGSNGRFMDIEPVKIGPSENSPLENREARPERVPEMESILSGKLQFLEGIIEIWEVS